MTDYADDKPGRAQSFAELLQVLPKTGPSEEQLAASKPYQPRSSDVIITPFGKCGTTMMQQMFHQLRMAPGGGDVDFDDISRVVPWIETAPELELDINAEQRADPRGFKSHLHYEGLPSGLRYVVTLRPPDEALVSLYHFFSGWFFEPGTVSVEEFVSIWLWDRPDRPNYYTHLLSWWGRRDAPDTLLMDYRAVLADKRGAIRRLADFCDVPVDDAAIDLVEERTSRSFMMEHKEPFADLMMRRMAFDKAGLPMDSDSAKIRAKDAERATISPSVRDQIDTIWAERIAPVTGHASYASLAAELASA
ncbi:sulfotransferase domain-containing protein [Pontixanthobacter aestiaquae]|uniref:Sulfotransferase n=1 Tax=Pontixanthobacter aestiaquae TaxID=1509367 RepID=A0A844Z557_9SPHN|nr:sulfotransferase domain-containing protein [Pontixanthobacter aestiaquae]MDN3646609.1 sulfotransferase domain-containing protein [Pontixanthobacter aestiaquae]MXO82406.1 sulfotransferase [Pontixanthobacter aestiaquae]